MANSAQVQEARPKAAKAPKEFGAYAANKCLVGYGLVNGIVNAGVFSAMHAGDANVTFALGEVVFDLALTGLILGIILFAIVAPLTKHDLKAGAFLWPDALPGVARIVPRSFAGALVVVGLVAGVLAAAVGALVAVLLSVAGVMPLGFVSMMVLKGCVCALVGAASGYLTISFVAR